jgi:hypothetical protein
MVTPEHSLKQHSQIIQLAAQGQGALKWGIFSNDA